jgi:hypothetical protein
VLGLSNYDWNLNLGETIAEWYKDRKPDGLVVMGGPNIRIDQDGIKDFLTTHSIVDAYCMLQGEVPFANFIRQLFENGQFDRKAPNPRMRLFRT